MTRGRTTRGGAVRHAVVRALVRAIVRATAVLALAAVPAGAQEVACDRGDAEVRALEFAGNRAFGDDQLGAVVVATPSSSVYRYRALRYPPFTWFGQRRCIRPSEVVLDRARLILFYRNHGYPDVTVDTTVTHDGRALRLRFDIVEGRAIRVDSVGVSWLATVPGAARILRGLPVRTGAAFDKLAIDAARDTILARLGNSGYPWAQVLANYTTDRERYTAKVGFDILPGTRTRIGRVEVVQQARAGDSTPHVSPKLTKKLTGLKAGAVYRDRDVATARRNLYLTEAYQSVAIERDSAVANTGADSLVNLRVTVAEGFMRAVQLSGGYGTIDCFRGQGDMTFRSVQIGGLATRLELTGRLSKIGRGAPFGTRTSGEALCPQISKGDRFDPYSDKLNYYGGVTLRQPLLSGVPNILPSLTVFSQRASEYKAFRRDVPIGLVATYAFAPRRTLPQVISYGIEFGTTTQAQPAVFCAVFNACQEEDRAQLERRLRTATAGWSITRNRANDPVNPGRGSVARLDLRHASKATFSHPDIAFNKVVGDMSWYLPGGGANVIALRLRAGSVFGRNFSFGRGGDVPDFVPQQERLFAGGAQTVRGFRQNELGPQVYVADLLRAVPAGRDTILLVNGALDTIPIQYLTAPTEGGQLSDSVRTRSVPTGGNRLVVANVEYRWRPPVLSDLLQIVGFVDAGNVWDQRNAGGVRPFLATPGFGVRVASPFGPIRVDFGYNPHAPARGAIFYEDVKNEQRPLYCVTPNNTIEVINRGTEATPFYQQLRPAERCPTTYEGAARRGWRAFNISLAIAQAF